MKPGPTGKYPNKKLNKEDRGQLAIGIKANRKRNIVEVHFGTELTWIGMGPLEARTLAVGLLQAVAELEKE